MPTGKPTFPLTTTSFSSSAGKRVPGASIEAMPCSVRTTSGVPAGIVTPNAVSTTRKARLAIPIQIKVCLFIFQCAGRPVPSLLDFGRTNQRSRRRSSLTLPSTPSCRCRDRNSARLSELLAELSLLSNLRCADSRTAPEIVFDHGLLDSSCAANRDAGTYIATSRAMRIAT